MKVIIHHPYGSLYRSPLLLDVSGSDTILSVKQQIATRLPAPVADQRLVRETVKTCVEQIPVGECELRDEMTLDEYAIPTGTAIHLYPSFLEKKEVNVPLKGTIPRTPFKPVDRELH